MVDEKRLTAPRLWSSPPCIVPQRWAPLWLLSIGACALAAEPDASRIAATQQAFTGRDVPFSVDVKPNQQYSWNPVSAGGTQLAHLAVSPDGAFLLLAESKASSEWSIRPVEALNDPDVDDIALGWKAKPLLPQEEEGLTLGGLGAVSFNPRFGLSPFRLKDSASCPKSASGDPETIPVDPEGPFDCYEMLVYAQALEINGTAHEYHLAVAPFYAVIDRASRLVVDAGFPESFRRITHKGKPMGGASNVFVPVKSEKSDEFSDHLTATADGRLIVFGPSLAYTFSDDPLAENSFERPASVWTSEASRNKLIRLGKPTGAACTSENEDCVRLERAYPVFQDDFKFADGTPIAKSTTQDCSYPWITPDGTELFCNAGSLSALAMIGKKTKGRLLHVDGHVQTTQQRYCEVTDDLQACDLANGANADCSPRGVGTGSGCDGTPGTLGTKRIASIGAVSGPWSPRGDGSLRPALPLLRRSPSLMMLSVNTALDYFWNSTKTQPGPFVYFEVPLDAAVDPDFLSFFHMNEAIMPTASGEAASGWNVGAPFGDDDATPCGADGPNKRAEYTADATGNGYMGKLIGTATFPFERNSCKEGKGDLTPNPGFWGRAIYFGVPGGAVSVSPLAGANPLAEALGKMTLELAVKPVSLGGGGASNKIVLLARPGSFEWSFDTAGTITLAVWDGAATPPQSRQVTFTSSVPVSAYTRLALTYDSGEVRLYRNGSFVGRQNLLTSVLVAATQGQDPLCIGPGCAVSDFSGSSDEAKGELLIDEVGISRVVRSDEYIAAAALAKSSSTLFEPVPASGSISWFNDIPPGLEPRDVRLPKAIVDVVNAAPDPQQRFERISKLGEALFVDDVLSVSEDGRQGHKCSICHDPGAYFAHPGTGKDKATNNTDLDMNTPSLLGRAFSTSQLHDRSAPSLLDQARRVIENDLEMGGNLTAIVKRLNRRAAPIEDIPEGYPEGVDNYSKWFNYAFHDDIDGENAITKAEVLIALSSYELTLNSGGSPVDDMLSKAIPDSDLLKGWKLFNGKGRCAGCHSGKNFTDELRHVTSAEAPVAFKTPSLRNVCQTPPFLHGGTMSTLDEVVDHYDRCGANLAGGPCAPELVALGLTTTEKGLLIQFLKKLSSAACPQ